MSRQTAAKEQAKIPAERASTPREVQARGPRGISHATSATASYHAWLTTEHVSDWLGVPKSTLCRGSSRSQGAVPSRRAENFALGRNEVIHGSGRPKLPATGPCDDQG